MKRNPCTARRTLSRWLFSLALLLVLLVYPLSAAADRGIPDKPLAKNIIVMIRDGGGYNHIAAADLYQYGRTGKQVFERFPFRFGMSTYVAGGSYDPALAWGSFGYVASGATDSAAAATAMATGIKTYDGGIGVDVDGHPVQNVVERAEELGKATGVVTSVPFNHATPAGFVAHNVSRSNYWAIAAEMLGSSKTDVIMGGGSPWFDADAQPVVTPTYDYIDEATWNGVIAGTLPVADADGDGAADPWTVIQTESQFQALQSGSTPERVFGIAQVAETLQQGRSGDVYAAPYAVPLNEGVPTLVEMTKGALNVLDNDPDGFFLMIEGGAVDWAAHDNEAGRTIEESIDFNRAVEAVVKWVNAHSNWGETLLIVTSDHETGYLTGPGSDPAWRPLVNNGAGNLPGMEWHSGDHTNSLVPIYAKGDAGRLLRRYADQTDPVRGRYIDNTEVGLLCFRALH